MTVFITLQDEDSALETDEERKVVRETKKTLAKTNASETAPTNMALNSSAQGTLGDMHGTIEPVNFVLDPLVVIGGR